MLLTDLFFASAAAHPDRPAVDVPPDDAGSRPREVRSYAELATMAAAVRARIGALMAAVASPESTVAILLPRETPWLYAAQIGVMSAGAVYVCLDGSFPDAHLRHVLGDARAVALLTDAAGAERAADWQVPLVEVPLAGVAAGGRAVTPEPPASAASMASSLAYIIYTSGTTGLPKGVLLEHRGVVNLITEGIARFAVGVGDRIAQGSSPAYDSSIEETWLALAAGATVVVLDEQAVRLGPDLVPWLRRERITILCPPPTLLRTMGCRSPSTELPALRLCYVGGEPLSADLAELWGRELWLENGYGPTECTVTVARGRVRPGEPVTIGEPVPPHVAHVLDERLQPVPAGTPGELCIAGPGLARGYLGLPALTEQRFPTLPGIGRVYRTGDLVAVGDDGRLRYLGRIDAQVKVRGYRIELEAIEAVLTKCEGVREAVCVAQGEEPERELVAHLVAAASDAAERPGFDELQAALRDDLPGYMVPSRFSWLERVPRTVGGKVDRRALPIVIRARADERSGDYAAPMAGLDRVRLACAQVLGMPVTEVGLEDDFFALGGNSLRAALLVTGLRRHRELEHVAVRDVYSSPTVAGLCRRLEAAAPRLRTGPEPEGRSPASAATAKAAGVAGFTGAQVLALLAMLSLAGGVGYVLAFVLLPWLLATFSLATLLLLGPWVVVGIAVPIGIAWTWFAILAKELLIGAYRPMRVSAWSGTRLRHWFVVQAARYVPWGWMAGTELQSVVLRAFGARIGRRVHIHRGVDLFAGGWDLLEIGDDVTVGREVDLGLCELDEGQLVIGGVRIAAGATLETRAGTGPDVEIGAGALVRPLSFVPAGGRVPPAEAWCGVPAQKAGEAPPAAALDDGCREISSWRYSSIVLLLRAVVGPLLAMPFAVLVWLAAAAFDIDGAAITRWLCEAGPMSNVSWVIALVALVVMALPIGLIELALLLRWLPRIGAGTHARWSLRYWWLSVRMRWLEAAGERLSGTLFWPWWLRLAGMRVGRDVEVSTILDVLPEQLRIGDGSFLADGVYLGVPRVSRGRVVVAEAALGARTFVGNHVVVEAGQRLPDDLLLGISTVADDGVMAAGSSWFGQPAFRLPRREVVEVDRALTHEPGSLRRANRLFWESLRVLLPALPMLLALGWFDLVAAAGSPVAAAMLATFGYAAALASVVLLAKWLLLGRVRPGQHGLWSCWASRWDFHYVMWQRYGRALLQPLEGTLLLPWYLRAMGMRIGRRCVLGDGFAQVVDPDMITIGDGATVHALFQAHSFEDRVLKIDRVCLGERSTVGKAAVVLYGADIGDDCHVMPHSVVMKRESLLPGRRYAGAPTVEVTAAGVTSPDGAAVSDRVATGPAATDAPSSRSRDLALDVARGLAVLGMVWVHFVPEPDAQASGVLAGLLRFSLWLEPLVATMFLFAVGTAMVAASARADLAAVARRTAALVALGLPFWWFVWPNDILIPIALMMLIVAVCSRIGRTAVVGAIAALLAAVPFAIAMFGDYVWYDCLEDGTHVANHSFGIATLRWFLFDGAYPLLPWAVLPLLGALLAAARREPRRLLRWWLLALPLPAIGLLADRLCDSGYADLAGWQAQLAITWQPTSLPFVVLWGGSAVLVVAGLYWWSNRSGLPRWSRPLALVGRASLTHYLAHTVLVYASMRWWWPDEDWSVAVGLAVAAGYIAFALLGSAWWFARRRRGPLEALLRWMSRPGPMR